MRKIISLLFALIVLASCGQGGNKTQDATEMEFKPVTVSEFISDAGPFVEEPVKISGTVVHVCRHGGQRLFIIGEDGEERIRITTGEDIAEFDVELEGESIEVTGIVKELIIDETYLAEWEAEVLEGTKHDRGEGHEGGIGHGDSHGDTDAEHVEDTDHDADHDADHDTHQDGDYDKDAHHDNDDDLDAEQQLEAQLAKIQKVRDEIAESGKDHLSDYWIETIELKVIKE